MNLQRAHVLNPLNLGKGNNISESFKPTLLYPIMGGGFGAVHRFSHKTLLQVNVGGAECSPIVSRLPLGVHVIHDSVTTEGPQPLG